MQAKNNLFDNGGKHFFPKWVWVKRKGKNEEIKINKNNMKRNRREEKRKGFERKLVRPLQKNIDENK